MQTYFIFENGGILKLNPFQIAVLCLFLCTACAEPGTLAGAQDSPSVVALNESAGAARASSAGIVLYPDPGIAVPGHSAWTAGHYPIRIAQFKATPLSDGDIVFVGDSLTEQAGEWATRLQLASIKNRGISGDTIEGVLLRQAEIIHARPKAVFLMIGINNLFTPSTTPAYVADNIRHYVLTLHKASPSSRIFVQTILPTANEASRERIESTNKLIAKLPQDVPLTIVDLHSIFADERGLMKSAFTHDGVHLTAEGYDAWGTAVKRYIQAYR